MHIDYCLIDTEEKGCILIGKKIGVVDIIHQSISSLLSGHVRGQGVGICLSIDLNSRDLTLRLIKNLGRSCLSLSLIDSYVSLGLRGINCHTGSDIRSVLLILLLVALLDAHLCPNEGILLSLTLLYT